jgi:hypothetical protein
MVKSSSTPLRFARDSNARQPRLWACPRRAMMCCCRFFAVARRCNRGCRCNCANAPLRFVTILLEGGWSRGLEHLDHPDRSKTCKEVLPQKLHSFAPCRKSLRRL